MLVAHRVAQFDACAHCHFGSEARQLVQMHDHHVTQLDSRDNCRARLGIPEQHVSIADMGAAVDRDRDLGALCSRLAEAALLRFPLVDLQQVDSPRQTGDRPIRDRRCCPERSSMMITAALLN